MVYAVTGSIDLAEGAGLCIGDVSGTYDCIEDGGNVCDASDIPASDGEPADTSILLQGINGESGIPMLSNFSQAPANGNSATGSGEIDADEGGAGTFTMAPASGDDLVRERAR